MLCAPADTPPWLSGGARISQKGVIAMSLGTESREGRESRKGVGGFFTSLPGILTASAAVITAAGGIYLQSRDGGEVNPQPPPAVIIQEPLELSSQSGTVDNYESGDVVDECIAGDVDSCTVILETLVQACSEGDGEACDLLYLISPAGSVYEEYGQTCGYVYEAGYEGWCTES
jgi:hypothetical protein